MEKSSNVISRLEQGQFDKSFSYLYGNDEGKIKAQAKRYQELIGLFEELFGKDREIELFSAPGRTEVGGNHTDHQHGRVLAASVNLDVIGVVSPNNDNVIRIKSVGYKMDTIDLADLSVQKNETNKAASLIRGVAARCRELGYKVSGFDAYTTSNVLKGSGLSSSAAFEVLVGTIISYLFNNQAIDAVQIAQFGQYAENVYFGKMSGLMDQMASSVGSFVEIDFKDNKNPVIEKVPFDFAHSGYALCIVDTHGNHADLSDEYSAMPIEMKQVAKMLGGEVLRETDEQEFYKKIPEIRKACGDRAVLRSIHFFDDNNRVPKEAAALKAGDFEAFKSLIIESGHSSYMYLQNVFCCKTPHEQGLSLALALSEKMLSGKGAWRVHGGGLAGTIQAFVPNEMLEEYKETIEHVFGAGSCHVLSIRPVGGTKITEGLGE
ncbi:galactokinase [Candidatus Soleaferrea massiliensis]|uniref:galactokinase n=1 Tax=Candidatus Soleaferrea massiliensis TaxID=1470354 RepID=UPI00058FFFCC|nr:galactokinase family protein [Candidatus Soleaferrea massiliensis]